MKPKTKLESYHELITSLETQFDEVKQLYRQRELVKAEAEKHGNQREEILASTVANTTEEAIDHLGKHNVRQEVFGVKLKRIEGQIEIVEEALQHSFIANFVQPFRTLYNALLAHRFERAKAQIARLIVPERVALLDATIEQLARQSKEYVSEQVLELYVPDGATSPLYDTPGAPWSQCRGQTVQILLSAVEGVLLRAKQLLATVESEKAFNPSELAVPTPEPVAGQAIEPEPALA